MISTDFDTSQRCKLQIHRVGGVTREGSVVARVERHGNRALSMVNNRGGSAHRARTLTHAARFCRFHAQQRVCYVDWSNNSDFRHQRDSGRPCYTYNASGPPAIIAHWLTSFAARKIAADFLRRSRALICGTACTAGPRCASSRLRTSRACPRDSRLCRRELLFAESRLLAWARRGTRFLVTRTVEQGQVFVVYRGGSGWIFLSVWRLIGARRFVRML